MRRVHSRKCFPPPQKVFLLLISASSRRLQRQARPCVQQAQNFPHHVQRITCRPPPVVRRKRVAGSGAYNGSLPPAPKLFPSPTHPALVRPPGDRNNSVDLLPLPFSRNRPVL